MVLPGIQFLEHRIMQCILNFLIIKPIKTVFHSQMFGPSRLILVVTESSEPYLFWSETESDSVGAIADPLHVTLIKDQK